MKRLVVQSNYLLLWTDTNYVNPNAVFSMKNTIFNFSPDTGVFEIKESGSGAHTFTNDEIQLGNVLGEGDVPYDQGSLFTFLTENTGNFNPAPGGSGAFLETVIEISSAQILAMGSAITLLASPGLGKYYEIQKVIFEYTHNTTAYIFPTSPTFYLDGCFDVYVDKILLTTATSGVILANANVRNTYVSGGTNVKYNRDALNSPLIMGTTNGDNPTTGNGTLRVIIFHKTRTFGE